MTEQELDQRFDAMDELAWECFAWAHPHEAHALDPERFMAFALRKKPGATRADIEQLLRETANEQEAGHE